MNASHLSVECFLGIVNTTLKGTGKHVHCLCWATIKRFKVQGGGHGGQISCRLISAAISLFYDILVY